MCARAGIAFTIMLLCCLWLLCPQIVDIEASSWSVDLPLSGLSAPGVDTYSAYMEDLYYATDERCRATFEGYYDPPELCPFTVQWHCVGDVLTMDYTWDKEVYRVPPLTWEKDYNWPDRIVDFDPSELSGAGDVFAPIVVKTESEELTYTNWTLITNGWIVVLPNPSSTNDPDSAVTSAVVNGVVRLGGVFITNTLYAVAQSNMYVLDEWVYDNLPVLENPPIADQWPTHDEIRQLITYNGNPIDKHIAVPNGSDAFAHTFVSPVYYKRTSDVEKTGYYLTNSIVNDTVPVLFYDPETGQFSNAQAQVTGTNYYWQPFIYTAGVVETLISNAGRPSITYDVCDNATCTSATRRLNEYFDTSPMDVALYGYLSDKIRALIPCYLNTTYASANGSYENYWTTTKWWAWGHWYWDSPYNWTVDVGGTMFPTSGWREASCGTSDGMHYPLEGFGDIGDDAGLPFWTEKTIFEATGAGIDLYRVDVKVNALNPAYDSCTNSGYSRIHGPIEVVKFGWEIEETFVYTQSVFYQELTVTNSNPQLNLEPEQDFSVELMRFTYEPIRETKVVATGFSDVYWCLDPNGNQLLNTNVAWISAINGTTFELVQYDDPGGWSWDDYHYYINPDGYVLVSRYTPFSYLVTAEQEWFLLPYFDPDMVSAVRYSRYQLGKEYVRYAYGIPMKETDSLIGWPSLGPSGSYYPGGYIYATEYAVELRYEVRDSIPKAFGTSAVYPYALDLMPWSVLTHWPLAAYSVSAATPNTTQIPEDVIELKGAILRSDDNGALNGFYAGARESTAFEVSEPGDYSLGAPYIALDDIYGSDGVVSTSMWPADAVWRCSGVTTAVPYYVAEFEALTNIGNKVVFVVSIYDDTNYVLGTNYVISTNIVKVLRQTNFTHVVDLSRSAAGTTVSVVTTNRSAVYSSTIPFVNPTTVDAWYLVLNALKYTAEMPGWRTTYKGWTNGVTPSPYYTLGGYYAYDATYEFQYPDGSVYSTNYVTECGDESDYGSLVLESGPRDIIINAPPVWGVGYCCAPEGGWVPDATITEAQGLPLLSANFPNDDVWATIYKPIPESTQAKHHIETDKWWVPNWDHISIEPASMVNDYNYERRLGCWASSCELTHHTAPGMTVDVDVYAEFTYLANYWEVNIYTNFDYIWVAAAPSLLFDPLSPMSSKDMPNYTFGDNPWWFTAEPRPDVVEYGGMHDARPLDGILYPYTKKKYYSFTESTGGDLKTAVTWGSGVPTAPIVTWSTRAESDSHSLGYYSNDPIWLVDYVGDHNFEMTVRREDPFFYTANTNQTDMVYKWDFSYHE